MEYVEGGDLFDYLVHRGNLPEDEAVKYLCQILDALDYCHAFKICHRDLKPENILMDKELNLKIADFGFASLQPLGWKLDRPCGTPHYAAPEVVSGKDYDGFKADIWSAGVILYALLAGSVPFDDDNCQTVLRKVQLGAYKMPSEFSPEAKDLIRRFLQVDPERRITIEEAWKHPLIRKHEKLAGRTFPRHKTPPPAEALNRTLELREIDEVILDHMKTLFHGRDVRSIVGFLTSPG